jgi:hypothetical protein
MEKEKKEKGTPPGWAASGLGRLSLPRARPNPSPSRGPSGPSPHARTRL